MGCIHPRWLRNDAFLAVMMYLVVSTLHPPIAFPSMHCMHLACALVMDGHQKRNEKDTCSLGLRPVFQQQVKNAHELTTDVGPLLCSCSSLSVGPSLSSLAESRLHTCTIAHLLCPFYSCSSTHCKQPIYCDLPYTTADPIETTFATLHTKKS
jgi:hypothetical protein